MAEQSTEQVKEQDAGKDTVRSPKYPYLTFQDALQKAGNVYRAERRSPTTPAILYTHLGYTKKTGSSGRAAAALKQYGLLDEAGGKYKISDPAFRYFNLPDESPEKAEILRQLAMRPPIFREVLNHFPDGLPSDATLKSYLILDKGFNENGADIFIRVLKAAKSVAESSEEEYDGDEFEEEGNSNENPAMHTRITKDPVKNPPPPVIDPPPVGGSELKVTFGPDGKPQLVFSGVITKDSLDLLQGLVNMRPDILDKPQPKEAENPKPAYPCKAMWKNKDHDQPVTVLGRMGDEKGINYYKIDGSETGIPENELEFGA